MVLERISAGPGGRRTSEGERRETEGLVFEVNFSLCGFEGVKNTPNDSGDDGKRVPPVPIPNTEVKPLSADGTWLATARESRSPPDTNQADEKSSAFVLFAGFHQSERQKILLSEALS